MAAASSLTGYTTITGLGDQAFSFSQPNRYQPYDLEIMAIKGHNLISVDVQTTSRTAGPNVATVAKNVAAAVLGEIG